MQVKDVMTKDAITVKRSTTLRQLLEIFAKFHMFPLVPVVENGNDFVGVVSFRNLINVFKPHKHDMLRNIPFLDEHEEDIFNSDLTEEIGDLVIVEDIMEKKFMTIREDISLEEAYKLMKLHIKEQFPVVDNKGRLVGIIGIFDIIWQAFHQKGVV